MTSITSVAEFHDLIANLHQSFYDAGEPDQRIELMLSVVARGRVSFLPIETENIDAWYLEAATQLKAIDASMYCIASEAWLAIDKATEHNRRSVPPSKRLGKVEVVATVACDRHGQKASSIKIIERYDAGMRSGAVKRLWDYEGGETTGGRMFDIFDLAIRL